MKKKIILADKIIVTILFIILLIFSIETILTNSNETTLSVYVAIPILIILVFSVFIFTITFIYEMLEEWREKHGIAILVFVRDIAIIYTTIMVCDIFVLKNDKRTLYYLFFAIGIVIITKILKFLRRV